MLIERRELDAVPEKSNSEGEEMIRSFQLTEHYSRVSVPQKGAFPCIMTRINLRSYSVPSSRRAEDMKLIARLSSSALMDKDNTSLKRATSGIV